eukprot:scaffold138096_cov22-Tisochrysis_lutea.AAC.1
MKQKHALVAMRASEKPVPHGPQRPFTSMMHTGRRLACCNTAVAHRWLASAWRGWRARGHGGGGDALLLPEPRG